MSVTTTSVELDGETNERVQRLAEARQRPTHWIVREAIEEYVSRAERRDSVRGATLSSWNSYEETGLHLTEDEADAWLAKLETGEDAVAPACHV